MLSSDGILWLYLCRVSYTSQCKSATWSVFNLGVQYSLWTSVLTGLVYILVSDTVQGTRCHKVLFVFQCPV
jgi:hypothetical protein